MVSKEERKWVFGFIVVILIITTVPYLIGFFNQNENWVFSGFVFGVEDGNSYIAKMLSGANGNWLFRTPYTAEQQHGALAFLPYLLLGKLTSPPGQHEQLVFWFQFFRWVAVLLCGFALYDFVAIFLSEVKHRKLALGLSLLGGGLGFLFLFGVKWGGYEGLPLEFYSPETFGFLSILGLPHLATARALLFWGFVRFLRHSSGTSVRKTALLIGGLWTLLGLMQPLTVVIGWIVLAVSLVLEILVSQKRYSEKSILQANPIREKASLVFWVILLSSPIPMYSLIAFSTDPFLREWTNQNLILSPPFLDYLLAFGLILPFAIGGGVSLARESSAKAALLLGWSMIFPILAYAPHNLQRRLPEGIWVVLCVLAVSSFEGQAKTRWLRFKPILFVGVLSTLLVFSGSLLAVLSPAPPLFRPALEISAFLNLSDSINGDVVLTNYDISNSLPAWVYGRTLIGHGPESINLEIIQPEVENFLNGSLSEEQSIVLLRTYSVRYVMIGPDEKGFPPRESSYLNQIFGNGSYKIYRVNLPEP